MSDVKSVNQVKKFNVNLVRKALKTIPQGTKNTVAHMTGLSIATCNTILNELAKSGEIFEVKSEAPVVGRPPKSYRYNENFSNICCICMVLENEERYLHYVITDLLGNPVQEEKLPCDMFSVEAVKEVLSPLMEKFTISTVSVGIPGYYYDGRIQSCGIPELQGVRLISELQENFSCNIVFENDLNATAYGLYHSDDEAVKEKNSIAMVAIFPGARIGAGIVIDGKILHGNTDFAGEIANIRYPDGNHKELLAQGEEGLIKVASVVVTDIGAIVNPAKIFFLGEPLTQDMLLKIRENAASYIPAEHLPEISYRENVEKYYIAGLFATAIEKSE